MKFHYLIIAFGVLLLGANQSYAYKDDAAHHGLLTGTAVEWFNHCLSLDKDKVHFKSIREISSTLTRRIRDGNMDEDKPLINIYRANNWHFYNQHVDEHQWSLLYHRSLERIFRVRLRDINANFEGLPDPLSQYYYQLGSIIHYLEDVTNPAHIVPVYHAVKITDNIDYYPIETERFDIDDDGRFDNGLRVLDLEKCVALAQALPKNNTSDIWQLMVNTSIATRNSLQQKICDGDTKKWESFWFPPPAGHYEYYSFFCCVYTCCYQGGCRPCRSEYFGKYAGANLRDIFGREGVQVNCGSDKEVSLPMYNDFVFERHLAAIYNDIKLFFWAAARTSNLKSQNRVAAAPAQNVQPFSPQLLTGNHEDLPLGPQTGFYLKQLFLGLEEFPSPRVTEQQSNVLLQQLTTISERLAGNLKQLSDSEMKKSKSVTLRQTTPDLMQQVAVNNTTGAMAIATMHDILAAISDATTNKVSATELTIEQIEEQLTLANAQINTFLRRSDELQADVNKALISNKALRGKDNAEEILGLTELDELLKAINDARPKHFSLD